MLLTYGASVLRDVRNTESAEEQRATYLGYLYHSARPKSSIFSVLHFQVLQFHVLHFRQCYLFRHFHFLGFHVLKFHFLHLYVLRLQGPHAADARSYAGLIGFNSRRVKGSQLSTAKYLLSYIKLTRDRLAVKLMLYHRSTTVLPRHLYPNSSLSLYTGVVACG